MGTLCEISILASRTNQPFEGRLKLINLHRNFVYEQYVINEKSDREIAGMFNVDRTTVSKFRKLHGIPTREYTGEIGERMVENKLSKIGFNVRNMKTSLSRTHSFDLLVNGHTRIEVKSSSIHESRWSFLLTNKDNNGISGVNSAYVQMSSGRWKKVYSKTCDFIILCGITDADPELFIVPSILKLPSTINIPLNSMRSWGVWKNRFDLLSRK